jgi:3-methyladenine DNA glycosylase Tag
MHSGNNQTMLRGSADDPLMLQYHDRESGVPIHDDRKHFEFLALEGARVGRSRALPSDYA